MPCQPHSPILVWQGLAKISLLRFGGLSGGHPWRPARPDGAPWTEGAMMRDTHFVNKSPESYANIFWA
jgi:hypothetical protein